MLIECCTFNFFLFSCYYNNHITDGLEYPLFNILEESIKSNIESLLDENEECWISDRNICTLYIVRNMYNLYTVINYSLNKKILITLISRKNMDLHFLILGDGVLTE